MKLDRLIFAICLSVVAINAQSLPVNPGDPLTGLSAADLRLFQSGREAFVSPYAAATLEDDGIIKRAGTVTCGGCHQFSAIGGADATFNGGAWRATTPLFGAGLVEGIPDNAILALQNRPEALALGISGRAAMVVDSATGQLRVGRFGWKAQHATLLDASAEGLSRYIGIPESVFRNEIPDPATGLRTIDRLAAFSRMLAPIGQLTSSPVAAQGEVRFGQIGCSVCHTRTLVTGPLNLPSNAVPINPFSDFLLHDIGTGEELRSAPLWGVRLRRVLLHDGSATTLTDAIRAHKGEATIVRQRFDALAEAERLALIEFLKTL